MALMARDHFAIELARHFELGWTRAQTIAGHRFLYTLDFLGEETPILT